MSADRPSWVVSVFLAICFIAVLLFLLISQASGHDIYTGSRNWDGVFCCNNEDCHRAINGTEFKAVAGGYLIKTTGEVIEIGRTGISPDAFWHVCRREDLQKTVRCLLVPDSGT